MDSIRKYLKEISDGKFRSGIYKISDNLKNDCRFEKTYNWLHEKYAIDGMGFKSIIKDFELNVGYSFLRKFINYLGFEIHSNKIANDFLKKRRSLIAKQNYKDKTGFFKDGVQSSIHHKNISRGIQGYYWNSSLCKYVWLRSSWEFIYAKWLNKHSNITWDVECREYLLSDGTHYRPDFFIFDDKKEIKKVIEIKGYWKNRSYKVKLLQDEYKLDAVIIEDIKPYSERNINEEIKLWKNLRKLKLEK